MREVYKDLSAGRKIADTTVLTMRGILEQKGHPKKKAGERAYVLEGELGWVQPLREPAEVEYCIYPDSGLLALKSPAPGSYTAFGYSRNLEFHGRIIPDSITSVCAGVQALEAHIAIRDAEEESLPEPTAETIARGPAVTSPLTQKLVLQLSKESDAPQTAVVHAAISPGERFWRGNYRERRTLALPGPHWMRCGNAASSPSLRSARLTSK